MSTLYRALRRGTLFKAVVGKEPFYWPRGRPGVIELGSKYGRWAIDAHLISRESVVASFGLGTDVTFELALIERFGCEVHGFDPTPSSRQYIDAKVSSPHFHAHCLAIADRDGDIVLAPPPQAAADQVSASAIAAYGPAAGRQSRVASLTLQSIRNRCNLERIDVLKLDVEGYEYRVLEQAARAGWLSCIPQLLVEVHHFLPGIGPGQTRELVSTLRRCGYEITWIGRTNHEYLFVRSQG